MVVSLSNHRDIPLLTGRSESQICSPLVSPRHTSAFLLYPIAYGLMPLTELLPLTIRSFRVK